MERFFLVPEAMKDQTFWLDGREYGLDENDPLSAEENVPKKYGFSLELDKLIDLALKDYLNGDTLYQTNDFWSDAGNSKTCLYRRGDLTVDEKVIPADMTFRINDGRYLSMYRSLPFDRILPKKIDDFIKGPEGVPKRMMPTYIHGYRWKTPDWLVELFENYVKKYCKDEWRITKVEELSEYAQT
jgi:hypothetical protein